MVILLPTDFHLRPTSWKTHKPKRRYSSREVQSRQMLNGVETLSSQQWSVKCSIHPLLRLYVVLPTLILSSPNSLPDVWLCWYFEEGLSVPATTYTVSVGEFAPWHEGHTAASGMLRSRPLPCHTPTFHVIPLCHWRAYQQISSAQGPPTRDAKIHKYCPRP